jgi:hypothetical protein
VEAATSSWYETRLPMVLKDLGFLPCFIIAIYTNICSLNSNLSLRLITHLLDRAIFDRLGSSARVVLASVNIDFRFSTPGHSNFSLTQKSTAIPFHRL